MKFGLLGEPVGHSRSPGMHAAAYRLLGMDGAHSYRAYSTRHDELEARVRDLRQGRLDGLNVTVPHKVAVIPWLDDLADSARLTGAVNTLVRQRDGRIIGHNTDAPALLIDLSRALPESIRPGDVGLVIGSGGAARAAVWALGELGLERTIVRARSPRADLYVDPLCPGADEPKLAVIVQATSAGMKGADHGGSVAAAVDWARVSPRAIAYDVVYAGARGHADGSTPFLDAARARGLTARDGYGMLSGQAALALSLWLEMPPPFAIMRAALDEAKDSGHNPSSSAMRVAARVAES